MPFATRRARNGAACLLALGMAAGGFGLARPGASAPHPVQLARAVEAVPARAPVAAAPPPAPTTTTTTAPPLRPAAVEATAAPAKAPAAQPPAVATPNGYGCGPALAWLAGHAAPGFAYQCPGYALGHQAMTCLNVAGVCPHSRLIVIADPCPAAYMNEAHNSWVMAGLARGSIDPYGYCS